MKRIIVGMLSILLLLSCITPVTALADSQSTTVRYSVPATVIYRDYDGTSTTQKVEVGTTLKAPKVKGRPGYSFAGWIDAKTGLLWDFTTPVTEHMTFTASYSRIRDDDKSQESSSAVTATDAPRTGDTSFIFGYAVLLVLSATVMVVLVYKKKKEE